MKTTKTRASPAAQESWKTIVARYRDTDHRQSHLQLANSILPYMLLWYLMYRSLTISYWLTLVLAIPAAGFMVRIFIIFHDCGHSSFFKTQRLNRFWGWVTGVFTFTPYEHWRHDHAIHHANAGDLDRRGVGDILTLTVDEYLALPWSRRLGYRLMRNPLIMFTIGAWLVFLVSHRFAHRKSGPRERRSVAGTNLILLVIVLVMHLTIGLRAYLLVQLPILMIGTSVGVWLFYIQHNYEGVYWARHENWRFEDAALKGSSFYQLPKLLQWFSGNIGFHHIHHLSPLIPNYRLEKCHRENPIFHVKPLTLLGSLKSLQYRLWDESRGLLVGWKTLKMYTSSQ